MDALTRRCRIQPTAARRLQHSDARGLALLLHRACAVTITDKPDESGTTGEDAEPREKS